MKTFEEKFTAWVDGELNGPDLAEFQAELAKAPEAEVEKLAARQLGDLLRDHGQAPELKNADFFNHQLMQRVETGNPVRRPAERRTAGSFWSRWSFARVSLAGACALLVAGGVFYYALPGAAPVSPEVANNAQVFDVHTGKDITASPFYSSKDGVTVVWLEGTKSVPMKPAKAERTPNKPQKD